MTNRFVLYLSSGALRQTLLGYAMGEASGFGVSKVDCIVSLVLSVNAEERLREMAHVFGSINEVRESMEVHIDSVGHRISKMQRGWTGQCQRHFNRNDNGHELSPNLSPLF